MGNFYKRTGFLVVQNNWVEQKESSIWIKLVLKITTEQSNKYIYYLYAIGQIEALNLIDGNKR